jgi:hypothetical protein
MFALPITPLYYGNTFSTFWSRKDTNQLTALSHCRRIEYRTSHKLATMRFGQLLLS